MKKLMIAAAAMMLGIAANAGSYAWSSVIGTRTDWDAYAEGQIYLIAGNQDASEAMVNTILAAGANWSSTFDAQVAGAANYATVDSEGVFGDAKVGAWDADNGYLAWSTSDTSYSYFALIKDADGFYATEVLDGTVKAVGATPLAVGGDELVVFGTDTTTYAGQGWYTAAPEPTSGLLLLLGMGALALRRRRA